MTREEALAGMLGLRASAVEWGDKDGIEMIDMAIEALKQREVVYCKDCKRHTENAFCKYWQSCGAVAQTGSYDFCSYAEKMEK